VVREKDTKKLPMLRFDFGGGAVVDLSADHYTTKVGGLSLIYIHFLDPSFE
jgi:hypothetical protein